MKSLNKILNQVKVIKHIGLDDAILISDIVIDSRIVVENCMFIAQNGENVNGHNYIDIAIEKGAIVIVCEEIPLAIKENITYLQVENSFEATGKIASNFYNNPTATLKVVGITGTNGKTTIATTLFQLFTELGFTCGLVSTVENKIGNNIIPSTHTTPHSIALQSLFSKMVDAKCEYVFIEVSSHAIYQKRIEGTRFVGGIFTNITLDHLDYHKTFDEYIRVKKLFFDGLNKDAFAITNIDDKRGAVMLQNTNAKKITYSLKSMADIKGKVLENSLTGLVLDINNIEIHFRMMGIFNAYNLLAIYAAALELFKDKQLILEKLSALQGAEGRFDSFRSFKKNVIGIVDYAHTPDALLNVLQTINQLCKKDERVITIMGCGGDRDKSKRPIMGEVAAKNSHKVIITSDNPRSENPNDILDEIYSGIPINYTHNVLKIENRRDAIKTACSLAQQGDIILLAGKGHEKYQETNGVKNEFDDKQELVNFFKQLDI